ncbi:transposase [Streptomyces sp. NPDC000345]|uniref:transposase n=1 Tax=Streptomyces sp. NPDC000345 TaxID=3364537 RepID=UPI00368DABE8
MQLTDEEWDFIGPYLPIGEYGPYLERLRQQFAGVIWRFRTGGQWREMPQEFGAWSTVHNRLRQWRDAGVFEALLEGLITEAAKRGEVDLSLVSVDSTTARAHHDAAGSTWARTSSPTWRRLPPRRRKPGQKGQPRRTERAGRRDRARAGGEPTHPASAKTPAEGRSPRPLQGRSD